MITALNACVRRRVQHLNLRPVELQVGLTKLTTPFVVGKNQGLFTMQAINANIDLDLTHHPDRNKINDPIVDLQPMLDATNNQMMYTALRQLKVNYYEQCLVSDQLNVISVMPTNCDDARSYIYRTLRAIQPGEELLRAYSLDVWLILIFDELVTNYTMWGYAKFLTELDDQDYSNDYYQDRLQQILTEIELLLNITESDLAETTLSSVDQQLSGTPILTSMTMYKQHPTLSQLYFS